VPEDGCDNIHSQSRRMIMVSPEPGFWIHTVSYCNTCFVLRALYPSFLPFFARILVADLMVIVHRAGKDATPAAHDQGKGQGGDQGI